MAVAMNPFDLVKQLLATSISISTFSELKELSLYESSCGCQCGTITGQDSVFMNGNCGVLRATLCSELLL